MFRAEWRNAEVAVKRADVGDPKQVEGIQQEIAIMR